MRLHQAKEKDRGEKERLKLVRSRETKSTAGTMDLTLLELCSTFQIDIFGKDVDNQVKKIMVLGGIRAVPLPAAKLEQLKEQFTVINTMTIIICVIPTMVINVVSVIVFVVVGVIVSVMVIDIVVVICSFIINIIMIIIIVSVALALPMLLEE